MDEEEEETEKEGEFRIRETRETNEHRHTHTQKKTKDEGEKETRRGRQLITIIIQKSSHQEINMKLNRITRQENEKHARGREH